MVLVGRGRDSGTGGDEELAMARLSTLAGLGSNSLDTLPSENIGQGYSAVYAGGTPALPCVDPTTFQGALAPGESYCNVTSELPISGPGLSLATDTLSTVGDYSVTGANYVLLAGVVFALMFIGGKK